MITSKINQHAKPISTAEPNTDEWLEARKGGLGASDCPAILGLSSYSDALDVWKSKKGEDKENHGWLMAYAMAGHLLESAIIDYSYREIDVTPCYGRDLPILASRKHPHLRASLDGYDPVGEFVIEVKTDKWDDPYKVPECHWAQAQQQMIVTGFDSVSILHFQTPDLRGVLVEMFDKFIDTNNPDRFLPWLVEKGTLRSHIVKEDKEWQRRWIARSTKWWQTYIVGNMQPPSSEDLEGTVDLSDTSEVLRALNRYASIDEKYKQAAKPLEKERNAAKKEARAAIAKYARLDADAPKRVQIGPHKATACSTKGGSYYWRLYPGEINPEF